MRIVQIFYLSAALMCAADVQRIRVGMPTNPPGTASSGNALLLNDGIKASWIFQASTADVVTDLLIRISAFAGTPGQYRASLQSVDLSNGQANGTILASSADTPASGWLNTVHPFTLGSSYTLTRGVYYAIVIEQCPDSTAPCSAAFTPSAGNSISVLHSYTGFSSRSGIPYAATYTGSTWTKQPDQPVWGYRTASTTRGFPVQDLPSAAISVGSETGVSVTLPTTLCASFKVVGARAVIQSSAAGKTIKMSLYDTSPNTTTVLQSVTVDSDVIRAAGQTFTDAIMYFADISLATLSCGATYRLGFAPQDSSNNFQLYRFDFAAASDRLAFPGGTMFGRSSRSSCTGGAVCSTCCNETTTAWTDNTQSRPLIDLILEDLTPPASGGGGQRGYTFVGALQRNPLDLFSLIMPKRRVAIRGRY